MALDVTLSVVSQLLGDWGSMAEEHLRAVTRGFEVGHFSLMAEMCQLLLPQGETHLSVQLSLKDGKFLNH